MPTPDEPRIHATVTAAVTLSPSLRRLRFAGPEMTAFGSSGDPDERVLVEFGDHRRSYTVRAWDPVERTVDIDFAVHAGGAAADWARTATVGAPIRLSAAKGWYSPPADTDRHLLLADLTALPAAARIVESLPAGSAAHLVAEIPEAADEQSWTTAADLTVTWLHGTGNGLGPSALLDTLTALAPTGDRCYLWSAGETGASRAVRAHVRHTLGLPSDRYHVMGYWQADKERWLARYAQVAGRIDELTARELASGKSIDEVRDAIDAALAREGL